MRWFVGLPVPLLVARELEQRTRSAMAQMTGVRLAPAEDLHLTLRFLGEMTEVRALDVEAALLPVRQTPFTIELVGVSAFRSVGAIYAEISPCPGLDMLVEVVSECLAWHGFARELRPFQPHVTLARARRAMPHAELERWRRQWAPLNFVSDRLVLFRSRDRAASPPTAMDGAADTGARNGPASRYEAWRTVKFAAISAHPTESF